MTDHFRTLGNPQKILIIPPDITRMHSRAGEITCHAVDFFGSAVTDILPALGTHVPMTESEIDRMFPGVDHSLFRIHHWQKDLTLLGEVPADYISEISGGLIHEAWPAEVNKLLTEGGYDLILSIGQVVPHEVIGMANYNKNIFVGTGGARGIGLSHYIGAVCGMESIMGRADNPVRSVLEYASQNFAGHLPIHYIQTVVGYDETRGTILRGIYAGNTIDCFYHAAKLAEQVNITTLEKAPLKVVVYLDPEEFRSTWLGNKAIYRTRMAIADEGELIILAPGVKEFGEDSAIDGLIRKYGYRSKRIIPGLVEQNSDLRASLGAAAHLIHGCPEGRFRVTYCPGHLSRTEIESVGYDFGNLETILRKYHPEKMKEGWNRLDHEEIFFIHNPALGLWSA
ncbi:MAG: DUF2088 domain-containing protein [Spirochaetales bacterium]|nr:DUF2088 domain-containing protein [Spirochaetales bacterium]